MPDPRLRLTITGRELDGQTFRETHTLDEYKNLIFPFHRRVYLETIRLERLPDPVEEET